MKTLPAALAAVCLCVPLGAHATGGAVNVANTVVRISPPAAGCQYVFQPSGIADVMTISVDARDAANVQLPSCPFTVLLTPGVGSTVNACTPLMAGVSAGPGQTNVLYSKAGGAGTFFLNLTVGTVAFPPIGPLQATSSDLNGNLMVDVVDLGIWAACLGGFGLQCDYNCDGVINIFDLAVWAAAIGANCGC